MENKFVSYKIAKKLNKLGYDKCPRFGNETSLYDKKGEHCFYTNYGFMYSGLSDGYIYAPLYQDVINWIFGKLEKVFPMLVAVFITTLH